MYRLAAAVWLAVSVLRAQVLPASIQTQNCPSSRSVVPPALTAAPSDFVELSRSGCFGSCPAYTVRLHRDGRVEWDGQAYVFTEGEQRGSVSADAAYRLLEQFRSERFWSLCGRYSRLVSDSATVSMTATIAGDRKSVVDYADSAPEWFRDLAREVDSVADTHRWRHGDPMTEPLHNILSDTWYAKPGVTPLMRAAARSDLQQVRDLLKAGAGINDRDASGWTALMYAAATWKAEAVPVLLEAGSDPDYASPAGDTALLARALLGRFSAELVRAGAKIDHQNRVGLSVLMLLASFAHPKEVADALQAGADPCLRDTAEGAALDYVPVKERNDCSPPPGSNNHNFLIRWT